MLLKIDGKNYGKDCKQTPVVHVYSGEVIDTVPDATPEMVDIAISAAQKGYQVWSKKTQYERNVILTRFIENFEAERESLAQLLAKENGKNIKQADGEFDSCHALFQGYMEKAAHMYGNVLPAGGIQTSSPHDVVFTVREPIGVSVCLLPFNYPIDLFGHKIAPALVAGNAVIIKPPTDCPLTILRMVELLHKSGVPENVVQCITGRGRTIGDLLTGDPRVQIVSMTGSTATGIHIYETAARNLARVYLELGGNDAVIVCEDADLDLAVREVIGGRMGNMGQTCCGSKRFIVQKTVADAFADRLETALKQVTIGDPMDPNNDQGTLISIAAAKEVEEQVATTISQGAVCTLGGKAYGNGFFEATVLRSVTKDMDVAKDMEIFGPVFPIIPYETLDEAIAIANQSSYGLMGAILTSDMKKAVSAAMQMECGGVAINGSSCYRTSETPFGGYKKSGIGREGVSATLLEWTQEKTIALKGVM